MDWPHIIVPAYIAVGIWFTLIEWPAFVKASEVFKSLEWEICPRPGKIAIVIFVELLLFVVILLTWPPVAIRRTYLRITTGKWTKDSPEDSLEGDD